MNKEENIIQIHQRDVRQADLAFAEFMGKAEDYLNDKANQYVDLYKRCEGKELEVLAEKVLKEIAPSTPFRPEDIILVSGTKFPDIQAGQYYGVEVKSTKSNSWSSTGSSIVESTRIPDISKIYMLFGKLGGTPAEFRCRPYEKCLSNIAVTHSPRYLIDMSLDENQVANIFDKMKIDYDTFRLLDEKDKIQRVRQYYKQSRQHGSSRQKFEMPWWIGEEGSEESSPMVIRFFSDIEHIMQESMIARMFILFTELFRHNYTAKYKRAALWMCSRYSVIDNSLRDRFTAGGRITEVGGVKFAKPVPQVLNTLYQYRHVIYKLLNDPDNMLSEDIHDFWSVECSPLFYYKCWLDSIQAEFDHNPELKGLNIRDLFQEWDVGNYLI